MSDELAILSRASRPKGLGCGFVFWCVAFFPIAIIMFFNRSQQPGEQTLTIRLRKSDGPVPPGPAAFEPTTPGDLKMSDDRESWWDGRDWVSADEATPPMARRNTDGNLWWDGQQWRAIS
jgi:hypothetical protein